MKRTVLGTLAGIAAGIALLHGCSSDDEGSSSKRDMTGGSAGQGGDSATGGSSATGGDQSASGGLGGALGGNGGAGEPVTICEQAAQGGAGNAQCAAFPSACGAREDYDYARFGTPSVDDLFEPGSPGVVFGLAGDDELTGIAIGSCLVGGPGDDVIRFDSDAGDPRSNVGVGGPGKDAWYMKATPSEGPAVLADIEADEIIYFDDDYGVALAATGSQFVEIIANFQGTNAELTKATTRIVYDPESGKIWRDYDGNEGTNSPILMAIVANADDVTLSLGNFAGE